MNHLITNISISLLLGAIWAVITESVLSLGILPAGFISAAFYPLLFTGFLFISSFYFDLEVGLSRILITGLSSGIVYYVLSLYFPLLSIVVVALLAANGFAGTQSHKSSFISVMLKGLVFIVLGIFTADVLISTSGALINSNLISWIILGSVLNLSFMLTIIPISALMNKFSHLGNNREIRDETAEFRSQTTEIIKDLESIHIN